MIVEDQALIGMSLEAFLEDAGFSIAGPFLSCADSLRWLEHNTPEVALLDVSLRDGTSLPIAQELKERNTPFAVYSGLPFTSNLPNELQGVPWLEKPAPREELTETMARLGRNKARTGGLVWQAALRLQRAGGPMFTLEIAGRPVAITDGWSALGQAE
jgi:DNA-binding response OmpR family regulator